MFKSFRVKTVFVLAALVVGAVQAESRWRILPDGTGVEWPVASDARLPHLDTIEMSGERVSLILRYGVLSNGTLRLSRHVEWPALRIRPNDTYGNYDRDFAEGEVPALSADGRTLVERPQRIVWDGVLTIESKTDAGLAIRRRIFPSATNFATFEILDVRNARASAADIRILTPSNVAYRLGCTGRYVSEARMVAGRDARLAPGAHATFALALSARTANHPVPDFDPEAEWKARCRRVRELTDSVVLETGDPLYDVAFRLAKIRTGESIFRTRGGVMHSPGGGSYYAATWCNDQVEYAGPWQAMTGDALSLEAAYTAYCQYLPFMADDYEPIPSSVIAEGFDIWNGAGDRGDAAMWAYGASRFALAAGRRDWALRLLPGIRWCLEYCRRRLTAEGVVASRTDELEGRLPAGKANLCTSALYCDALRHASALERDLGDATRTAGYAHRAKTMEAAIERYFGAEIHDFQTYRYYDGCTVLRSWIGIPLCMGIEARAEGTVSALFSRNLWTGDGMLSAEGGKSRTTWDRSVLYAFRGAFASGQGRRITPYLRAYTQSRLLGEHVPYPVEAWPEGGRRHLAGESALYCRIFTEGVFGIDPTGLTTFRTRACLPEGVSSARLRHIRLSGRRVDLEATADGTCRVLAESFNKTF